ncbi:MAG TPA: winged helix-turn-helix domain-containing protein [Acidobacteriaceae bacterium]|jgi:DNA-binding MarR family transcriptional regulator|nr:winged helix-turn-helix domain-containing protein [Acidobacteriaceae bacterium]
MLKDPVRHLRKELSFLFLTNHAFVLILLSRDNRLRMREIAEEIGITERAVKRIVDELVVAGYLSMSKSGRRNVYSLNAEQRLRHPILGNLALEQLLRLSAL